MREKEFLEKRRVGIGGSDAPIIMGFSKYKSKFQIFEEKMGRGEEEESEKSSFGWILKNLICDEFSKRTGKKLRRVNKQLVHKEHPFIIANIDRVVLGEKAILMCRTTSAFNKNHWEGEEIKEESIIQAQHYMGVTGALKCYIAVLIGGQTLKIKEVNRDEELINLIINEEISFWKNHVEKNIPPRLDGKVESSEYLKRTFKGGGDFIDLGEEVLLEIRKYLGLKSEAENIKERLKEVENNIKNEMGDAEVGRAEGFLVNWKSIKSIRVDSKKLKEKHKEVYDLVAKESLSRRFEIKEC